MSFEGIGIGIQCRDVQHYACRWKRK